MIGMQITGSFDGDGLRIGVIVARFNDLVTSSLADGCRKALARYGVADGSVDWTEVPGSRELPVAARAMAVSGRYDAVIALGCVMRGETVHFDLVCQETSRGLGQVATDSGVPVLFGVLATETLDQALQRAGGKVGNAGWDAAVAAIETASVVERIQKGGGS